ncbi:potassium channel family protein [Changchengzhania lutea]|uniref:potassium channel family protein n=1 Tax=Changchengzhania lutea TaxID=2049305 RepID=UPI00115D2AAF|nr:potassium channel family protein [Changchengzhania lutea]
MNYILLSLGVLIYIAIIADIIMTTLTVKGGGWLTGKISHWVWKLFLRISGNNGESTLLAHVGYLLLVLIAMIWVVMFNLSFILLLASDVDSVINSTTNLHVNLWEKIYYSGFVISTLGIGDFIASSNLWRSITILYSFTGLIFITMSITYFIPVLTAVIKKRKLGISLSSLGNTPQDIVLNALDADNSDYFKFQLLSLSDALVEHSQNHRAYPVIHYFHNNKKDNTIILQIARLNEAIHILRMYVKKDRRPNKRQLTTMESALNNYVEVVMEVSGATFKKYNFDKMELNELKAIGVVQENVEKEEQDEMIQKRRTVLRTLVKEDGWDWADVAS